jgi:hypothetical protein
LGFTLRESKMLHAICALGNPLSAADAMPIWKLAGNPVLEYGYPAISPACVAFPRNRASSVSMAGELQSSPTKVGQFAA